MGQLLLLVAVAASVSGFIGLAIGNNKGRGATGFWLGFFLGAIGWLIVGVMRSTPEAEARRTRRIQIALGAIPVASSLADELLKLGQLRDSCVLSEEEFLDQKRRLLGQAGESRLESSRHVEAPELEDGIRIPLGEGDGIAVFTVPKSAIKKINSELRRSRVPRKWDGFDVRVPRSRASEVEAIIRQAADARG